MFGNGATDLLSHDEAATEDALNVTERLRQLPLTLRPGAPASLRTIEEALRASPSVRFNKLSTPGGDPEAWRQCVDFYHRQLGARDIRIVQPPDWLVTRRKESDVEIPMGIRSLPDIIADLIALLEKQFSTPFSKEHPFTFVELGPGSGDLLLELERRLALKGELLDGRRLQDIVCVLGVGDVVYTTISRILTGFSGYGIDEIRSEGLSAIEVQDQTRIDRGHDIRAFWSLIAKLLQYAWHNSHTSSDKLNLLFENNDPYALPELLLNPKEWLDENWILRHPDAIRWPADRFRTTPESLKRNLRLYMRDPNAFLLRHAPDLLRHCSPDDPAARDLMARSLLVQTGRIIPAKFKDILEYIPPETAHLIFSRRALSHSKNLSRDLDAICETLAPGGALIDDSVSHLSLNGANAKPDFADLIESNPGTFEGWDIGVVRKRQPSIGRDRSAVVRRPPVCSATTSERIFVRDLEEFELVGLPTALNDTLSLVTGLVQRAVADLFLGLSGDKRPRGEEAIQEIARMLHDKRLSIAARSRLQRSPGRIAMVHAETRPVSALQSQDPFPEIRQAARIMFRRFLASLDESCHRGTIDTPKEPILALSLGGEDEELAIA